MASGTEVTKEFRWEKDVSSEITHTHIKRFTKRGPLHINIIRINPNSPEISIRPAMAGSRIGNIERVDSIALRENAVVAINGSFFESRKTPHLPVGILVADGKVINKSLLHRSAMGITRDNNIVFGIPKIKGKVTNAITAKSFSVWGVNRPRKKDEVIIYTPEYGRRTRTNQWGKEIIITRNMVSSYSAGNSEIPEDGYVISFHGWTRKYTELLPVNAVVEVNFGLSGSWKDIKHVISGGPLLLKNGKAVVKTSVIEENFRGSLLKPTARTAVGIDEYGKLYFFVVDRRRFISAGVTYSELAKIMKETGIMTGMALDGGGTSTLVINGTVKNYPMYGYPVAVSNALIVEETPEPAVKEFKDIVITLYEKLFAPLFKPSRQPSSAP